MTNLPPKCVAVDTLLEAKALIADWRKEYSHVRIGPHGPLGYRPSGPKVILFRSGSVGI